MVCRVTVCTLGLRWHNKQQLHVTHHGWSEELQTKTKNLFVSMALPPKDCAWKVSENKGERLISDV